MKKLLLCLALLPAAAWAGSIDEARDLIDRDQTERAVAILEASLADPSTKPEALILLTRLSNDREDWKRGIDWGEQAVKLSPESSEAHFVYAHAIRIKMQNVSKMKAMFSLGTYKRELAKAIELDPGNVDARSEEIGYLLNAPGFAGGSTAKARQRIAELKPLDWRQAMLFQAELLDKEKDPEGALATYREMLERDPEDGSARLQLAFRLQQDGQYEKADVHFARLRDGDDARSSMMAQYQMARSRVLGQYEAQQAVDYLRDFIERLTEPLSGVPSKSNAFWRLGMAYEQLQRTDQARTAYETAIELDGDNKNARESLKKLLRG